MAILPGVNIREKDTTYFAATQAGDIPVALVGVFEKGDDREAFLVSGKDDAIYKLGSGNPGFSKDSYHAIEIAKETNLLWIKRVCGVGASYAAFKIKSSGAAEAVTGGMILPDSYAFDNIEVTAEEGPEGDGVLTSFAFTLAETGYVLGTLVVHLTVAAAPVVLTDDGTGVLLDSGDVQRGTVNPTTGAVALTLETAQDDGVAITVDYEVSDDTVFVLYLSSKGDWGNGEYAFTIHRDYDYLSESGYEDRFILLLSQVISGGYTSIIEIPCSRLNKLDEAGNSLFIEDAIPRATDLLLVKNNPAIAGTVLPFLEENRIFSGGSQGGVVSDSDIAAAWSEFENKEKYPDITLLCDSGHASYGVANAMKTVAEARKDCVAMLSVPYTVFMSGAQDVVEYRKAIGDFDGIGGHDAGLGFNTSWCYIYDVWSLIDDVLNDIKDITICPSALATAVAARSGKINPYLPPAGIQRGNLNVKAFARYWKQGELQILADAQVNAFRRFSGVGRAVFSEFSMQTVPSYLSYFSARMLMISIRKSLDSVCMVMNFETINERLYDQFHSIVDGIFSTLLGKDAVESYEIFCDESMQTQQSKLEKTLNASIVFTPTSHANTINIDLVLAKSGAKYSELVG